MHSFCLLTPFLFMWFAVHTPGGADVGGVSVETHLAMVKSWLYSQVLLGLQVPVKLPDVHSSPSFGQFLFDWHREGTQ